MTEYYDVHAPQPCPATDRQYLRPDGKRVSNLQVVCGGCKVTVEAKNGQPTITEIEIRDLCWVPEKDRKNFTVSVL